ADEVGRHPPGGSSMSVQASMRASTSMVCRRALMCRLRGGLLVGAGRAAAVLGVDEGTRRAVRSVRRAAIGSRSALAWRLSATDTALVESRCRLFNVVSLLRPVGV